VEDLLDPPHVVLLHVVLLHAVVVELMILYHRSCVMLWLNEQEERIGPCQNGRKIQ
jgi:hypothetical protein